MREQSRASSGIEPTNKCCAGEEVDPHAPWRCVRIRIRVDPGLCYRATPLPDEGWRIVVLSLDDVVGVVRSAGSDSRMEASMTIDLPAVS